MSDPFTRVFSRKDRVATRRALALSCVAAISVTGTLPAAAAPWVKGYVVGFYEFAFHYGGRDDFQRGSEAGPGVDCPHGSTTYFSNPKQTAYALSLQPWRTKEEIEAIANPPSSDEDRAKAGVAGIYYYIWRRNIQYRGYRRDIQTYINPFAADDPGQPEVNSRIGEGLNLDGKIKPTDFVSPDGEKGIDNNLYRAWGCDAPWRGNGNAQMVLRSNDKMQDGLFTVVIRVSGNKNPMNDDQAILEIGYSPDHIMKDARGSVATDYSYRILKSAQYTKLKAKVKNGVVETEQAPELHMPQIAWFANQNGDANFHQAKIRLTPNSDGTASALVGGYRDWRDLYAQNTYAQDGGNQGIREHEDDVALYFAMRRNADGMFNPKTGRYDGISTAYRLTLADAFVVDPDKPMAIPPVDPSDIPRKHAYDISRAAMIKATGTLVVQPIPPGSSENIIGLEQQLRDAATAKAQAANGANSGTLASAGKQ